MEDYDVQKSIKISLFKKLLGKINKMSQTQVMFSVVGLLVLITGSLFFFSFHKTNVLGISNNITPTVKYPIL